MRTAEPQKLLFLALKNELEATQCAAAWLPTTKEVAVKLALARLVRGLVQPRPPAVGRRRARRVATALQRAGLAPSLVSAPQRG